MKENEYNTNMQEKSWTLTNWLMFVNNCSPIALFHAERRNIVKIPVF